MSCPIIQTYHHNEPDSAQTPNHSAMRHSIPDRNPPVPKPRPGFPIHYNVYSTSLSLVEFGHGYLLASHMPPRPIQMLCYWTRQKRCYFINCLAPFVHPTEIAYLFIKTRSYSIVAMVQILTQAFYLNEVPS